MIKGTGNRKKRIVKGMAALLACALVLGMAPYPAGTVLAEADEDEGGTAVYDTTYQTVSDGDGNITNIETYWEDGKPTGSMETTKAADGTETTVWKDADGKVSEKMTSKTEKDENGNSVTTDVIYDGQGKVTDKTVTTESEDGKSTTRVSYDGEDQITEKTVITESEDGTSTTTVTTDKDDQVILKRVTKTETDENGNTVSSDVTYDGNGKVTWYDETTEDAEGRLVSTRSESYDEDGTGRSTLWEYDEHGNVTGWTEETFYEDGTTTSSAIAYDADGRQVRAVETTKDRDGRPTNRTETIENADGSSTRIDTTYDKNGNKTGSTETLYVETAEPGVREAVKTVIRDADDKVVRTETHQTENDGKGTVTFTNTTYGADGKLQEEVITTINTNTGDTTIVSRGADGREQKTTIHAAERFSSEVDTAGVQTQAVTGLTLDLAKSVCTAEELAAYEAGSILGLRLETKEQTVAATSRDAAAVQKVLQAQGVPMTGVRYFDISLYKSLSADGVTKDVETKVTDTGNHQIGFVMVIPEELRNQDPSITRTFYVVRVHDGVGTVLAQGSGDQIPVASSLFSVYAIAYRDEAKAGTDNGSKSNPAGNAGQTAYATSPKTGEETPLGALFLPITLIVVACVVVRKKGVLQE